MIKIINNLCNNNTFRINHHNFSDYVKRNLKYLYAFIYSPSGHISCVHVIFIVLVLPTRTLVHNSL